MLHIHQVQCFYVNARVTSFVGSQISRLLAAQTHTSIQSEREKETEKERERRNTQKKQFHSVINDFVSLRGCFVLATDKDLGFSSFSLLLLLLLLRLLMLSLLRATLLFSTFNAADFRAIYYTIHIHNFNRSCVCPFNSNRLFIIVKLTTRPIRAVSSAEIGKQHHCSTIAET